MFANTQNGFTTITYADSWTDSPQKDLMKHYPNLKSISIGKNMVKEFEEGEIPDADIVLFLPKGYPHKSCKNVPKKVAVVFHRDDDNREHGRDAYCLWHKDLIYSDWFQDQEGYDLEKRWLSVRSPAVPFLNVWSYNSPTKSLSDYWKKQVPEITKQKVQPLVFDLNIKDMLRESEEIRNSIQEEARTVAIKIKENIEMHRSEGTLYQNYEEEFVVTKACVLDFVEEYLPELCMTCIDGKKIHVTLKLD